MWGTHDGMGWWMLIGTAWFAVLVAVSVAVAVRLGLGGQSTRRTSQGAGANTALQIARERYARGEITREEFQQIERDLQET